MTAAELVNVVKFNVDTDSLRATERTAKALQGTLNKYLGAIGIGLSIRSIIKIVEEFSEANDALKAALDTTEKMADATEHIRKAANESRQEYTKLAQQASKYAALDVFNGVGEGADFSANVTKWLTAHGHASSDATVQSALNRAMQTGNMVTLQRLLAQTPEMYKLLAQAMGKTTDQIKQMMKAGTLTAKNVKDAFLNSTETINEAFEQTDVSISDAIKHVRNNWGFFLNEIHESIGLMDALSRMIKRGADRALQAGRALIPKIKELVDRLGGVENVIHAIMVLAIRLGSVAVIGAIQKFLAAFSAIPAPVKVALTLLYSFYLLIQDLIYFMRGDGTKTALGQALEELGVNADDVRGRIQKFFDDGLDFLHTAGDDITELSQGALGALKLLLDVLSDLFGTLREIYLTTCDIFGLTPDTFLGTLKTMVEGFNKALQTTIDLLNRLLGRTMESDIKELVELERRAERTKNDNGIISGAWRRSNERKLALAQDRVLGYFGADDRSSKAAIDYYTSLKYGTTPTKSTISGGFGGAMSAAKANQTVNTNVTNNFNVTETALLSKAEEAGNTVVDKISRGVSTLR